MFTIWREYDLKGGNKDAKVHYFSSNPNGRREIVSVKLRPRSKLKKLKFNIEFLSSLLSELSTKKILKSKNDFWSSFNFRINIDNDKKDIKLK